MEDWMRAILPTLGPPSPYPAEPPHAGRAVTGHGDRGDGPPDEDDDDDGHDHGREG